MGKKAAQKTSRAMPSTPKTVSAKRGRTPSSAEGEGRVMRSLRYQYEVVATRVYDALRDGLLDRVWLGDSQIGPVDDAVLRVAGNVVAYNVKFDDHDKPFSFADFLQPDKRGRSLIRDLYDGYRTVYQNFSNSRIKVVFATNRPASKRDRSAGISMSKILNDLLAPITENAAVQLPEHTKSAYQKILTALGISDEDARKFLHACSFELDSNPGNRANGTTTRKQDIQALFENLWLQRSERGSRKIELTPNQILQSMNWIGREGFKNSQQFPIEPQEYEPLFGAFDALEQLVSIHQSGYIAVLGGPGSGKSTLLQDFINRRPDDITVRYFAYVKNDLPIQPREEAKNFLHDACKQIRMAHKLKSDSFLPDDIDQLRVELNTLLEKASALFQETSRRTIIIIDGLDHVGRREDIPRKLTDVLPAAIPTGVLFILGSQHLDALDPSIRYSINRERTLEIHSFRLSALQIKTILSRVSDFTLSTNIADQIVSITQGHPLALTIAIQVVRKNDAEQILSALDKLPTYTDPSNIYFEKLFADILKNGDLRRLFATLARLRRPLQQDWLASWSDYEHIKERWFLFRRDDNIWTFAHDSLRHFIARRTAENGGIYSNIEDKAYHRICANICANASVDIYRWEELFHRICAGEDSIALQIASQEWFRTQYLEYRNPTHIRDDIAMMLRIATRQEDGVSIWRLTLALSELSLREYNVMPMQFTPVTTISCG